MMPVLCNGLTHIHTTIIGLHFLSAVLQVCQGDRIRVTVRNALDNSEGLTIHWHGQHQRTTPHMDGTSMITQCPIPRPQTFTYDFLSDTPGTQWWHSHSGLQRADGLFGPVVVRQRKDDEVHSSLYDIDDHEHVIMMSDWTDTLSMQHMMKDLHADGPGGPDAILINGRGTKRKVTANKGNTCYPPPPPSGRSRGRGGGAGKNM